MATIEHPGFRMNTGQYEGRIVYDDSVSGKRPAIYMQPDWLGVCLHTVEMAVDVGQSDYVVLLVDMYGKDYGGMEKTNEELGRVARGNRSNIEFILGCGAAAGESDSRSRKDGIDRYIQNRRRRLLHGRRVFD